MLRHLPIAGFLVGILLSATGSVAAQSDNMPTTFGSPLSNTSLEKLRGSGLGNLAFTNLGSGNVVPHCNITLPDTQATVSRVLKTGHDTVKNAIGNIR